MIKNMDIILIFIIYVNQKSLYKNIFVNILTITGR